MDEVNKVYKWLLEVKAHDLYKLSPLKLPTALVKFVRVLSIEYHASVNEEGKFHETPKKNKESAASLLHNSVHKLENPDPQ